MKICIPILFQPGGGGFYFLKAFAEHVQRAGWEVTSNLESAYDILFTNHWQVHQGKVFKAIRYNPRVRVVQRIDGAAQDYGRHDNSDREQRRVNELADLTIFQSKYCRYSTRDKFGVIIHDGPIIHNPVDSELFTPDGDRTTFPESVLVACVSWSTNPLKGAESIYAIARQNPAVGFVLCGQYPNKPDLPNLHAQGVLDRRDLATALRSCHLMVTFSQNEACPNHVLEAMASGLPVLYHDSGAMAEIIADCGLPVTQENFAAQLGRILAQRDTLGRLARERALQLFSPDKIFSCYQEALQEALHRPTVISTGYRLCMAWTSPVYWRTRWAVDKSRAALQETFRKRRR